MDCERELGKLQRALKAEAVVCAAAMAVGLVVHLLGRRELALPVVFVLVLALASMPFTLGFYWARIGDAPVYRGLPALGALLSILALIMHAMPYGVRLLLFHYSDEPFSTVVLPWALLVALEFAPFMAGRAAAGWGAVDGPLEG